MALFDPALQDEPSEPAAPHRPRRRRIARWILLLVVVAGVLLSYDAYRSARVMLNSIKQARSDMDNGIESVVVGDTTGAPPQLQAAITDASRAVAASNHPSMKLLSLLPVVGDNIRATRAVATAIEDSSTAALTLEDAAGTLGWGNILIPGARSIGNVDLAKIQAATPKIDLMSAQLQAALIRLRAAGGGHLLGPVATGYRDVSVALTRRAALASDMKTVFHLLPTFLGTTGQRSYLVAVQSLAMPQATGGTITSVGVLTAHHGTLQMGAFSPASAAMAAAAASPDVPTDAVRMLKQAKQEGMSGLQGVLLTDSVGLSDMLWMSGPAGPLTTETVVSTLERQLYLGTNAATAPTKHAQADTEVLRGFLSHRPSVEAFATGMAQALSQRHLYIWMPDPAANALLSQLGATGKFQPASLTTTLSTTGNSKVGYYLRQTVSSTVILDAGGAAAISTTVRVANGAKTGTWDGVATVYLPTGSTVGGLHASKGGVAKPGTVGTWHVANGRLKVKPGGFATLQVDYHQPDAATRDGSTWTYRLVILPQPTISPTLVHISIKLPDGMKLVAKANRLTEVHGTWVYDGNPAAALTLWISYR